MKKFYKIQRNEDASQWRNFLIVFAILIFSISGIGFNAQAQFNVTGDDKCAGQTATIGLDGSVFNDFYHLIRDDGSLTHITFQIGQGTSITYAGQTVIGKYEVYQYNVFTFDPNEVVSNGVKQNGDVTIFANPVPVVTGETNPCFNYSETYSTDAGMSNYGWSVSNGSIVSGGGSVDDFAEISWNGTPGAASVSVNYTDGNGCTSASATVYNVDVKYPVYIGSTGYSTLQAAINAASTNDLIDMVCDHSEGFVAVNKDVTIDGNGNTLTSTSSTYGLAIQSTGIIVKNITVDGAGTFGIHQQPNSGNLWIENSTVQNGGGTGFALNCSDNTTLKNITSTGNLGNGVSITNCSNVTIDGITTSGNAFSGGFSAGVGIFSNSSTCTPDGTDGVTLTGVINISEPVTVYEQATTGTITNITLPTAFTYYLGLNAPANSKFYYTSLQDALDAAEATLTANSTYKPMLYVRDMATGDLFVEAFTSVEMSIQAAVDAAENTTIYVGAGTYPEVLYIAKELDIRGPNYGINPNSATRNPEAIIQFPVANDSWYLVYIDGDGGGSTVSDVSLNGFEFNGVDSYGGTYPTELIFIAGAENVTIKDNIFKNFEMDAIRHYYQYWDGTNWVSTWPIGADISDNYISNPDFYFDYSIYGVAPNTGIYIQGVYGNVSGNVVEHVLSGCQIQPYGHPNTTSVIGTVSGNTFKGSRNGVWYNNSSSTTADWLFSGNTISGTLLPSGYTPGASWYGEPTDIWYGFAINGNSYGEVAFTGNTIAKGTATLDAYGIRYVHGYAHAPKTAISGNTIDNLDYGIYLPVNLVNVGEITINNNSISGNSEYGIYNATTFALDATSN
ncbi:MAG: right-handed parallel beta-helix repeat-containing protein, partial [Bacteroidales bacterium]